MSDKHSRNATIFKAFCDENNLDYTLIENEWLDYSKEAE